MIAEIRIYIEGGGDSRRTKSTLRQGFQKFLSSMQDAARSRKLRWEVVLCGGRQSAYEDFCTALRTHKEAVNILLVDSEAPVSQSPWNHLRLREGDGWKQPQGAGDKHCHLMVQTVEAWLIADPDALVRYYGRSFNRNAIPGNQNVEEISKDDLYRALEHASEKTQKGEYRKIQHCADLLKMIDPILARKKSAHCERLFTEITGIISGN